MSGVLARLLALAGTVLVLAACGATPPVPSPSTSNAPLTPRPSASLAPGVTASPAPSPSPSPSDDIDLLPTPSTTDVVLLVADAARLSTRESQWLEDLRGEYGRVDALAHVDASATALSAYFTVFVIDQAADLDVGALAAAYGAGLTIHLVGTASAYQAQVAAGAP